ncbi:FGGY-family carbohydrate kinase [Georgenia sp. SUBG003]|uniref:FGGY-family carbohydrate kinase n=1 Tax=Georgenia sp. SUBG003 TaxID=1497974 RepID=UPI003AB634CC
MRTAGARIGRVQAVGGGARSALWLQILADVLAVPVLRRSLDTAANSLGAAVTGLVGLGLQQDFSVARSLTEVTAAYVPERDPALGEDLHARYEAARDALLPWFEAGAAAVAPTPHLTERGA